MDVCNCSKEKDIGIIQTEIKTLFNIAESNKKSIVEMNRVYDLIYGLTTNVSILAEQMARNTDDLGHMKKDIDVIKSKSERSPEERIRDSDFNHYKRQSEKYEHYTKVAVGAVILALIGAFMAGKMF